MNFRLRKWLSGLTAAAVTTTTALTGVSTTFAKSVPYVVDNAAVTADEAGSYGLADNVQDGTILHCFNWTYNDIKTMLPQIAEAGFTSVQTSPAQTGVNGAGTPWYWLYQPLGFYLSESSNGLGTKAELKALCTEADKYGIKVVVDVVANHMAGDPAKWGSQHKVNGKVDSSLQNLSYYHDGEYSDDKENVDWKDRYQVTHCDIGMPDLDTANTFVQTSVYNYIQDLKSVGVDGIRFDAAKHIGVPSESDNFWKAVTKDADLFYYGEILEGPNNGGSGNDTIMKEYTSYISVTDDKYGESLTWAFNSNGIKDSIGNYSQRGVAKNKLVYWAESHDTYANGGGTRDVSQGVIDRSYAVLAAQAQATTLYFSRPAAREKNDILIGVKGSTHFTSKEVAEVNKFHNAMIGTKDYTVNDKDNNVTAITRENGGAVIVRGSGSGNVTVKNGGGYVPAGTYTDRISGNPFTVTSTTISGNVGSSGIAVIYEEPSPSPTVSISQAGGSFSTDTLSVTVTLKNATSGTYKIGSAAAKTFTSTATFTIGSGMNYGDSVDVVVTATDGKEKYSKTYTFNKVEQVKNVARLYAGSSWGDSIYCYAYDSATELVSNAKWPGVKMTKNSAGYFEYEIPENIKKPRVIFCNEAGTKRYPADMEKGLLFETDGTWQYKDSKWSKVTDVVTEGKVVVKYLDEAGNSIKTSTTLTGKIGASYTTTAPSISGYTLKTTPSNATGKYTEATITVKYVYTKNASTAPTVTASVASGSSFDTETKTVKLTLSNAVSGTYSVDDGPVKSFTSSASVVIGEGKIADSVVTIKATAKNSAGTVKNYTFTYNKKFNGTVNVLSEDKAAATLDSQYATNKVGTGVKKTITVDGSIADWSKDMLIAQGAANDDPRVYRDNSMYEVPIDLYALYACYDDKNLYLMWEMTNVQDVVAPDDNYPLSQGVLFQNMNVPFFIALSTGDSASVIGNSCKTSTGGTLWGTGITYSSTSKVNKVIAISTNGANGPYVYGGNSSGINPVALYGPVASEKNGTEKSAIQFNYGLGILSTSVKGINGAYGKNNNRVVGDMTKGSTYVDFNTKGHKSSTMDFHYEMAIPLSEIGTTASKIASNGIGVMLVATMGKSGMDCLPYDTAMNDNADQPDTESQEFNSYEKSDADNITVGFASVGTGATPQPEILELNFGGEKSAPQTSGTALTLKGIAMGGSGSYTYKYYVGSTLLATKTGKGATTTTWTPSAAGKYTIKCVVTDGKGNTVTSAKYYTIEGSSQTTLDTPVLSKVYSDSTGATVVWKAVDGATGYYVYRKSDTETSWTKVGTIETGATVSYTDKTAVSGNTYTYTVKATNGTISSSYDKTGISLLYLAAPTLVSAKQNGNAVEFTWKKVTGASEYYVYRKTGDGSYSKLATVKSSVASYTDTTVVAGTTYTYTVKAVNGTAVSYYHRTGATVTVIAETTLDIPKLSSIVNSSTGITVKWEAVKDAEGYNVYRKSAGTSWTKVKTVTDPTKLTATDDTVESGVVYTYTVRAYKGSSSSKYDTNGISIKYLAAPKLGTAVSSTYGNVINWSTVEGATRYAIYRKTADGSWKKLGVFYDETASRFVDTTAKVGTTYYYTVRALDEDEVQSSYDKTGIKCIRK